MIVLVLLAVSALSFSPAFAEQIQSQVGTVIFHLTGQATSLNATLSSLGAATLDLIGRIRGDGEGGLVLGNLTGRLQIVSVNYTVSDGNGSSNRLGEFALYGKSSAGELVLHGLIQNNSTVTVDAPPSRLSSIAYLALSGTMNLSMGSRLIVGLSQNLTSTNVGMNSTIVTKYEHPSSSNGNFTSQTETTTETATLNPSNSTTVSYALSGRNNTTITLTRLNNQSVTIVVTGTVANSTITQTTTMAETTITRISSAPADYNTTFIVTNSTQSVP